MALASGSASCSSCAEAADHPPFGAVPNLRLRSADMTTTNETKRGSGPGAGRRMPAGAEVVPAGVHFRVWAPRREAVAVVIEERDASGAWKERSRHSLEAEGLGYHSGVVTGIGAGV